MVSAGSIPAFLLIVPRGTQFRIIMKKVVLKAVETTVFIDNVENGDHIGIQWTSETKGIIVEVQEGYCILNNDCDNKVGSIRNRSKKQYLKDRVSNGDVEDIFVFDSYTELLKWFTS